MNQHHTPFASALKAYQKSNYIVFNTPGHKAGKGIHPAIEEILGSTVFSCDICDVLGEPREALDPDSVLHTAESLLAAAYGVDHSKFLANGSTLGVQAAVVAAYKQARLRSGTEPVGLLDRGVHRSAVEGLLISGSTPVYIRPRIDPGYGIPLPVNPADLSAVCETSSGHPGYLLVVSPTYHGIGADLREIVKTAHSREIPVIVDEAHGPHFHFNPRLPLSAVDAGADICVQSAHKVLGALTQASFLHSNGSTIDSGFIDSALDMLGSTSPSYLLYASLDVARMQMATSGRELWERTVELAGRTRCRIDAIEGLECIRAAHLGLPENTSGGRPSLDPTRLTVSVRDLGISGLSAARYLRYKGIEPEMGDLTTVVFILTWADNEQSCEALIEALRQLAGSARRDPARVSAVPHEGMVVSEMKSILSDMPLPEMVLTPRDAYLAPSRAVSLAGSEGEISAELVAPYPPGIPLICPGERISPEVVRYLSLARTLGIKVSGPIDKDLVTIRVVA